MNTRVFRSMIKRIPDIEIEELISALQEEKDSRSKNREQTKRF